MDTGGYGAGVFEIWRLWVPPVQSRVAIVRNTIDIFYFYISFDQRNGKQSFIADNTVVVCCITVHSSFIPCLSDCKSFEKKNQGLKSQK